MKCAVFAVLAATATATNGSSVQHLVELLTKMSNEVKNDRDAEEKAFTVTTQQRSHDLEQTQAAIERNENKVNILTAEIEQGAALIASLSKDILDLDTTIDKSKKDESAATAVRDMDASDFASDQTDLEDTISAVKRALETLRAVNKNTAGEAALVQLKSEMKVHKDMLQALDNPVAQDAGNAFESKTGGPIGILENIQGKCEDELYARQNREKESQHAYEMLMNELKRTIDDSTDLNTKKKASLAEAKQSKATAKGDKTDAEETLAADRTFASDLKTVMSNDQAAYESRQALREEEIQAIGQAVEVIKEMSTSMLLVQLGTNTMSPNSAKTIDFLTKRGTAIHSTLLTQLAAAANAQAGADPFKKIKKMIQDLIVKLMEEATAESTHEGWCKTELSTNEQTRNDKTDAVTKGSALIDQLNANIADAKDTISDLNEALAELTNARAEATAARTAQHNENKEVMETAEADLELLAKAKAVLADFYGKAVEGGAGNSGDVQSSFEGENDVRKGDAGANVIGMVESIETDTSRLRAETKADDDSQAREHKEFMRDTDTDMTEKKTVLQNTQTKLAEFENNLAAGAKELKANEKALADADRYYEKLKPSCVDSGDSFKERTARRKEEIESLQEALKILSGDADF